MKLYNLFVSLCFGIGIAAMTSCSDDNGSNPIYNAPKSFNVYAAANMGSTVDLKHTTDSLQFVWSQPDFGGMPLAVTYNCQMSFTGDFSEGNYIAGDNPVNVCSMKFAPADVNTFILQKLNIKSEEQLPDVQPIYYRFTATTQSDVIVSDTLCVNYHPYYVKLSVTDPQWWYLTGSWVGTSGWGGDLGTGMVPLYPSSDADGNTSKFDESTGNGTITWTGYVDTNGFKIRGSLTDNWATQIGQGDSFGEFKLKTSDGEGGNITPDEAGLYTITINTAKAFSGDASCITMTKYEGSAPVYSTFNINGSFDGWGAGKEMSAVHPNATENHDWCITMDIPAGAEVKFQTGGWAHEIGFNGSVPSTENTYYGVGKSAGGGNIYIANSGTYYIQINDITNSFIFIKK